MKLSKNEKKTLKLLLENSRVTDTEIGNQLNITSQAVHKIKEKLSHRKVIKNYVTEINYSHLGVHIFAIAMVRILPKGRNTKFMNKLLSSNVINLYNVVNNSNTHIMNCGFTSMEELWAFFDKLHSEYSDYIKITKVYTFPHSGFIKNSPIDLFKLLVEESGSDVKMSHLDVEFHYDERKPPRLVDLNDNEKNVLKLLVKDAAMSCCKIADSMPQGTLTHSGVNKIKKKLEMNEIISRYSINLDYEKLGIGVFAFIFLKKKSNYWKLKDGLSNWALSNPNVIGCYKLNEDSLHILQCGFRNLDELKEYCDFLEVENKELFEIDNVYISSLNGVIRNTSDNLFLSVLEN